MLQYVADILNGDKNSLRTEIDRVATHVVDPRDVNLVGKVYYLDASNARHECTCRPWSAPCLV